MGQEISVHGVKQAPKYESNPFVNKLTIKTKGRKVTVSRGSALIDVKTGEIEGVTEVAQIIEVDDGQFIKLFTKDLASWFDLSKGGMKVFGALLTVVQKSIGKDIIYFDIKSESLKPFQIGRSTYYRGVDELLNKGFIARHLSPGWFFINPAMFFNGDRARFIKEYRKVPSKPIISIDPSQQFDLLTSGQDLQSSDKSD